MAGIALPAEVGRFVREVVAAGRFRRLEDVIAAGVVLLERAAHARAALLDPVLAARQEAGSCGSLTGDDLLARVEARHAWREAAAE